jgi:hypothetical protein
MKKTIIIILIVIIAVMAVFYYGGFRDSIYDNPVNQPVSSAYPGFENPGARCLVDEDCFCSAFTGAEFLDYSVVGRCNLEAGNCYECYYE